MDETSVHAQQRQLSLPVQLRDEATLENFLPGPAEEALMQALQEQPQPSGEPMIFLHGPDGCGKSHLLQACCQRLQSDALYLPLAELLAYPPGEVLAGVESLRLIALDDLDAVIGLDAWELALFSLYNRARESGCRLLLAAQGAPRVLPVRLPDLKSRLTWGVVFHLAQPSDAQKQAILQFRARRRGLQLPVEVAAFIVNRSPRQLPVLLELLDRLDRASLTEQRALSVPFVKQTLNW